MAQPFANMGGYRLVGTFSHHASGEEVSQGPILLEEMTIGQAWCLYLSHFLSMWNSRLYEFGVVSTLLPVTWLKTKDLNQILFIQAAFPGNLTASSIK